MRTEDKNKPMIGMAAKTINFEKIVLMHLEAKAQTEGISVSKLVNLLCRRIVLSDEEYYRQMSKHHYLRFQEYQFMKDQAVAIKSVV